MCTYMAVKIQSVITTFKTSKPRAKAYVNRIISSCIKEGLFNKNLFSQFYSMFVLAITICLRHFKYLYARLPDIYIKHMLN